MTKRDWKNDVPLALKILEGKLKTLPEGMRRFSERSDPDNVHRNFCDKDVLWGTWHDAEILFRYLLAEIDPNVMPEPNDEDAIEVERLIELLEGKP